MNQNVREANLEDIPRVAELNMQVQELHSAEHPEVFKKNIDEVELHAFLENLVRNDSQCLLVFDLSNSVIGYAWAEHIKGVDSLLTHGINKLYIHQICVDTHSRQSGVGRSLLVGFSEIAEKLNVDHIGVDSWVFNSNALSFFKAEGYEDYNIHMWKRFK